MKSHLNSQQVFVQEGCRKILLCSMIGCNGSNSLNSAFLCWRQSSTKELGHVVLSQSLRRTISFYNLIGQKVRGVWGKVNFIFLEVSGLIKRICTLVCGPEWRDDAASDAIVGAFWAYIDNFSNRERTITRTCPGSFKYISTGIKNWSIHILQHVPWYQSWSQSCRMLGLRGISQVVTISSRCQINTEIGRLRPTSKYRRSQ